jgi:hypothetical protein
MTISSPSAHSSVKSQYLSAYAAWRLVLSAKTLPEVQARMLVALEVSSKTVPACKKLLEEAKRGNQPGR